MNILNEFFSIYVDKGWTIKKELWENLPKIAKKLWMCLKLYTKLFNGWKKYPINFHVNINHIYCITKFKKWPMNFTMNAAEKVNVEVLVWISAKNNLTAVVKMHELSQYVVKSISRVWVIKFMYKKLLKNRFWYRYEVIYEHLQHFFIESQKNAKKNALGIKINLNLDQKRMLLQNHLIIYIPHTLEFICTKLGVIWVVLTVLLHFKDTALYW